MSWSVSSNQVLKQTSVIRNSQQYYLIVTVCVTTDLGMLDFLIHFEVVSANDSCNNESIHHSHHSSQSWNGSPALIQPALSNVSCNPFHPSESTSKSKFWICSQRWQSTSYQYSVPSVGPSKCILKIQTNE